jgi:hypothetical protein
MQLLITAGGPDAERAHFGRCDEVARSTLRSLDAKWANLRTAKPDPRIGPVGKPSVTQHWQQCRVGKLAVSIFFLGRRKQVKHNGQLPIILSCIEDLGHCNWDLPSSCLLQGH